MRILEDTDLMPWGKYKDNPMQDVPASYFHWLWHEGKKNETETDPVANYIKRNLSALKQEAPNKIWS